VNSSRRTGTAIVIGILVWIVGPHEVSGQNLPGSPSPDSAEDASRRDGEASEQKAAPIQLWCLEPLNGGGAIRSLISIDAAAKYVKVENSQSTYEFRNGAYAKAITGGLLSNEAQKVHQLVLVDNNQIKWGIVGGYWVAIDRTTAIRRDSGGHTIQCSLLPSKRQF
jgi:hypothetical protein